MGASGILEKTRKGKCPYLVCHLQPHFPNIKQLASGTHSSVCGRIRIFQAH